MKLLIAADMEGISGVVNWDQVDAKHSEYVRFRKIMTGDVNAAIRGAFEAGATEVVVTDGHGAGNNILIEELDPRAHLNTGSPSPYSMVQGAGPGVEGAFFVGYHARAGSQNGILDHTWSSRSVANVWLNGQLVGETGLNAALCGHYQIPVLLITGDQTACAQAIDLLGPVETAVVKQASGRSSAECLPLVVAQQKICEAAANALYRLRTGTAPQPFRLEQPVELSVEFFFSEMADMAAMLPKARRVEAKRITISFEDMPAAYRTFRAAVSLARP